MKCGTSLHKRDRHFLLVREHKVARVPEGIFGKKGEGYLRLSFAASPEKLEEGISHIQKGIEDLEQG
jgi:aspartate/methionine/tyrosine aminotransferase